MPRKSLPALRATALLSFRPHQTAETDTKTFSRRRIHRSTLGNLQRNAFPRGISEFGAEEEGETRGANISTSTKRGASLTIKVKTCKIVS